MKINYYQDEMIDENHVDIYYYKEDYELLQIMNFFHSYHVIHGKNGEIIKRIFPSDIFYLEMVDRHCYCYLKDEVYQIDYNLKSFLEHFSNNGFIQIGKSSIANVYKIERIKVDLNMKMRLFMTNGETLILNRSYKKSFMDYLKHLEKRSKEGFR